jgi:hypothetical protein
MPHEIPDLDLPPGSRVLGYTLMHPWDGTDYASVLTAHCHRRSWVLELAVLGDGPTDWYGGVDDEWPRVVRTAMRLGVRGVITPSPDHLAPARRSRCDRVLALATVGIVVRTVQPVAVMTQ